VAVTCPASITAHNNHHSPSITAHNNHHSPSITAHNNHHSPSIAAHNPSNPSVHHQQCSEPGKGGGENLQQAQAALDGGLRRAQPPPDESKHHGRLRGGRQSHLQVARIAAHLPMTKIAACQKLAAVRPGNIV
jgi:hypothetical protein